MRCHRARTTALALTAVLVGLSAAPGLAASLAVVDEGDDVLRYELVLEPGEVVAGVQLDLLTEGASVVVLDTGFSITLGAVGPFVINPWTLTSLVAPVGGVVRVAHTHDQGGNLEAGWSGTQVIHASGLQLTYQEFLQYQLGIFTCDPFECFHDFEPTGIPIARLLVGEGAAPTRYTAAICVAAAGATCTFPETNVPEPVVLLLLPFGMFLVTQRRGVE